LRLSSAGFFPARFERQQPRLKLSLTFRHPAHRHDGPNRHAKRENRHDDTEKRDRHVRSTIARAAVLRSTTIPTEMDLRDSTQARRLLQIDSPSVQSHLTMLQGVVNRLAANSASCKTWCVSLVSALAVVAAQAGKGKLLLVAAAPILLLRRSIPTI